MCLPTVHEELPLQLCGGIRPGHICAAADPQLRRAVWATWHAGSGADGAGASRNNLSFGLNYQRNESDTLEPFATVRGNTHTNGFNANVGWAVSKGKLSNQLRFTWNRSRAPHRQLITQVSRMLRALAGINGVSDDPLNWGVPGLAFSDYTSLSDIAPSQRDSQTFTLSESFGWVRGKHHLHFGGDYRWINNKAYASSNPRGAFTFTGSSTANYVNGRRGRRDRL